MNLAFLAALVFTLGMPLQVKAPKACDHAAPPEGMRWVCANEEPCDCHLAPSGVQDQPEDSRSKSSSLAGSASYLACRIVFFVLPTYPETARQEKRQGIVSASLVLTAEGTVDQVRIESGDPQLASAVRSAMQQWRFTPGNRPENIPVSVNFVLSDNPTSSVSGMSLLNTVVTTSRAH